jgi:hypothetical protein
VGLTVSEVLPRVPLRILPKPDVVSEDEEVSLPTVPKPSPSPPPKPDVMDEDEEVGLVLFGIPPTTPPTAVPISPKRPPPELICELAIRLVLRIGRHLRKMINLPPIRY